MSENVDLLREFLQSTVGTTLGQTLYSVMDNSQMWSTLNAMDMLVEDRWASQPPAENSAEALMSDMED